MSYDFAIYTNIEELKADWDRINNLNNELDIYQLYEFNYLWCKSHPNVELHIYVCLKNNEIIGIIPLMKKPDMFWYYLTSESLKSNLLFANIGLWNLDYANIIAIDEHRKEVLSAWINYLENTQEDWDCIHFNFVKCDWLLSNLEIYNNSNTISIYKTYSENFILYLENNFDYYISKLGKDLRSNWRNFLKIMQNDDSLMLYEDNTLQGVALFKEIHTKRWNQKGMTGVFDDETYKFYKLISKTQYFHMLFLKYKGETLGGICYFDFNGCRYYAHSAIAVDKKINASISTGKVLLLSSIKNAYELGLKRFDFLNGKEIYKYIYTQNTHEFTSLVIYNKKFDYKKMVNVNTKMIIKGQLMKFQKEWSSICLTDLKEYEPPVNKQILIIAPHFDDEIIGCGGLIQFCNKNGYTCDVLFMTNSDTGNPLYSPKQLVNIINEERKNAKKIIGHYNEYYLNVKDGFLQDNKKYRKQVEDLVDFSKYGQIFVPDPNDSHNDHRESYKIINSILKNKKYPCIDVFIYESINGVIKPNIYLDIKDMYQNKIDAIQCYKSQISFDYDISFIKSKIVHYKNILEK